LLVLQLDLSVLGTHVEIRDGLSVLATAWLPELFDVAGERLGKHFGVESRELPEDGLVHELLRQGERLDVRYGVVVELGLLGGENIVIADVSVVDVLLGTDDALLKHVDWCADILFIAKAHQVFAIKKVRLIADGPLSRNQKVNLCHVALLLEYLSVVGRVEELAWHETSGHLEDKV
jgi:hypothetical protein